MKTVLFDLDGTIIDSSQGIFRSFQYAFSEQGLPLAAEDALKECVGPPLLESFLRFHGGNVALAEEGVRIYRRRYASIGYRECALYEGCKENLSALRAAGLSLALATGKPQPFAEKILQEKGILSYFDTVVGSKLDNSFDDKGEIIRLSLTLGNRRAEECVMVGDRAQDGWGAKANGMPFVGFRGGFERAGELEEAGAVFIAADHRELCRYLLARK